MAASNYRKEQTALIYDLIELSNPGFTAKHPIGSVVFGKPTAIAVDSADPYKRDTEVQMTPASNTGYRGFKKIRYRRIDMAVLFRDIVLQLDDYLTTSNFAPAAWQAKINAIYGLSLVASDYDPATPPLTTGSLYSPTLTGNGLCYKGTFQVRWTQGKKPMIVAIPDNKSDLVGRLYPGGNDFPSGRKPVGEWQAYAVDLSSIKSSANLEALSASQTIAAGSTLPAITAIIDELKKQTNRTNWSTSDSATDGGLGGLVWYKYSIPSSAVVEANPAFNRAIVIQSTSNSWFGTKIIIHWTQ